MMNSKKIGQVTEEKKMITGDLLQKAFTGHNGQIRSQGKSAVKSRWPLRATETYEFYSTE